MSTPEEVVDVLPIIAEAEEDERVLEFGGADGLTAVLVEGEEVLLQPLDHLVRELKSVALAVFFQPFSLSEGLFYD